MDKLALLQANAGSIARLVAGVIGGLLTAFDYGTSAYRSVILSNGVFIAQ